MTGENRLERYVLDICGSKLLLFNSQTRQPHKSYQGEIEPIKSQVSFAVSDTYITAFFFEENWGNDFGYTRKVDLETRLFLKVVNNHANIPV